MLLLDSSSYEDRISAGLAMEDLCQKMQSYELAQSVKVRENIEKMVALISGKYFNKKEMLIDSFTRVLSLHSLWSKDLEFRDKIISICHKQIEKFALSNPGYKNKMMECLNSCLQAQQTIPSLPDLESLVIS